MSPIPHHITLDISNSCNCCLRPPKSPWRHTPMYITATGVGVKFDIKKVDDISLSARAAMLHLLAVMEVNAHRLNLPKEEFTELLEKEIGLPLSAEYPTILTLDLIQKINKAINDIFRKLAKSENKRQE